MSRFAILYAFHKIDSMSLDRLTRLKEMNPETTIIPYLGLRPKVVLPALSNSRFPKFINRNFIRSRRFLELSRTFNERTNSTITKNEICSLYENLRRKRLTLYCDYTPFGYLHQDLGLLRWFSLQGNQADFDFLVFYEYDMITTKPIPELYQRYTRYDACFVHYDVATPAWAWYNRPFGARRSVCKWTRRHGGKCVLVKGLFSGHIVSRKVLERLQSERLPFAFNEMRWPTVINALGFRCARLFFPMMSALRPISLDMIKKNLGLGIFHPVREDFDLREILPSDRQST